jgi:hypothetical protein
MAMHNAPKAIKLAVLERTNDSQLIDGYGEKFNNKLK